MAARITVILETKDDRELARVLLSKVGQDFLELTEDNYPLLSEIDDCSLSVFTPEDMPALIIELAKFSETQTDVQARQEISEAIDICQKCESSEDRTVVFTAFGDMRQTYDISGV